MPLDRQTAHTDTQDVTLLVPTMTCGACMSRVERAARTEPGVAHARVNLTAKTVAVAFDPAITDAEALINALAGAGYGARPLDQGVSRGEADDRAGRALLLRLGVAGFASMNVMLLSISIWSGADDAVRDLLHWVSALIALPAIAFTGQPFYRSAAAALAHRRMNMDVPISLAVTLAAAHSVYETVHGGQHAYFDAAIMLLFFLLIGRYLEHRTRCTARSAAAELLAITGRTARRVLADGMQAETALSDLRPGMVIAIAPGERIPADGTIAQGTTELDRALITGEARPEPAYQGDTVHAGMLNISGAIQVTVTATGDATLLAEIAAMVEAAQHGRGRYDRIADRAARIYAPLVHVLAAAAFVGWYALVDDGQLALQIAVAVLIVTCPCALALAVPTVHTVTGGRLFAQGIFMKDGSELERLADIDMVVFDKTGTLTDGAPHLASAPPADDPAWPVAAALAAQSRHPFSRAISAEATRLGIKTALVQDIQEQPGIGVSGLWQGQPVRLGRGGETDAGTGTTLTLPNRVVLFTFTERLRPGAAQTCAILQAKGIQIAVLSGDRPNAVASMAAEAGITAPADHILGGMLPSDKLAWLEARRAEGRRVLMVGDGLNDGPALAAAHASMSPSSAVDVAKTAAGLVFTGCNLGVVAVAHQAALTARRRAFESFAIAAGYNALAIPMAMAGFVTPLFAALAMSGSSILVILNALRRGRPA